MIQNDAISKAQTDLNNSIKNLFIDGQKKEENYRRLCTSYYRNWKRIW